MFILAKVWVLAGILLGLVIDELSPIPTDILGGRMPIQANEPWLSIVPIAESRSSYNGLLVLVFITISASLAVYFIHRFARMRCFGDRPAAAAFPIRPPPPNIPARVSRNRSAACSAHW